MNVQMLLFGIVGFTLPLLTFAAALVLSRQRDWKDEPVAQIMWTVSTWLLLNLAVAIVGAILLLARGVE